MQTERRDFDIVQLLLGAACQAWILGDGEPDLHATAYRHDDLPVLAGGLLHGISQGIHATPL